MCFAFADAFGVLLEGSTRTKNWLGQPADAQWSRRRRVLACAAGHAKFRAELPRCAGVKQRELGFESRCSGAQRLPARAKIAPVYASGACSDR